MCFCNPAERISSWSAIGRESGLELLGDRREAGLLTRRYRFARRYAGTLRATRYAGTLWSTIWATRKERGMQRGGRKLEG
jgi:hypothetical protein